MNEHFIRIAAPDRYYSLSHISWWRQDVVKRARVLVVGAGALGNEVLKNLALVGVGHIHVVDFDHIEVDNLTRSVLYREEDVGRPKAEIAAMRTKDLNPGCEVTFHIGNVLTTLGLGIFRRFDVVVGCLDNKEARLAVNESSWAVGTPWVDGGIRVFLGQVTVFVPGQGSCYECDFGEEDYEQIDVRYSCSQLAREAVQEGKVPTTPTIASITGAIQVQEVLKLLHGMSVEAGARLVYNGATNEMYAVNTPFREDCLGHRSVAPIVEMQGAKLENTTFSDIFAVARGDFDDTPVIELDSDLVLRSLCHNCQSSEEIFVLARRISWERNLCPTCNRPRQLVTTHHVIGDEPFARKPLKQLGYPPLEIFCVAGDSRVLYYELTGDESALFSSAS